MRMGRVLAACLLLALCVVAPRALDATRPCVVAQSPPSSYGPLPTAQSPPPTTASPPPAGVRRTYLYVWTGAEKPSRKSKDFIVTVDVTLNSSTFGSILSVTDTPYWGLEPHHAGSDANGTVLALGSFHSFLLGPDVPTLLFYDIATDPKQPKYRAGVYPEYGALADDWVRLGNGGFLVSLMGDKDGGTPGRLAEVSPNLTLVAEHPRSGKNTEGFNPHGLGALPARNRIVSVDLVDYSTTLNPSKKITYRTTVRVWDLAEREILKVVNITEDAKSLMDVMAIGTTDYVYVTSGSGWLWGLNVTSYELSRAIKLYDVGPREGHCVLSTSWRNGTRLLASLFSEDKIVLLNTTVPSKPTLIWEHQLPYGAGPHAVAIDGSERLITVTSYYLQQDKDLGTRQYLQDNKVRFFRVAEDGNSFKPHETVPELDFPKIFKDSKGGARPHGVVYKTFTTAV